MNAKKPALHGVLPVFQTPFLQDESIDFSTLEREIDWLYDCGVDGIVMAIYRLSMPLSSVVALQNSLDAFLAIEKHLLVRQGIFRNTIVRGPTGFQLDSETRDEVDRLFGILTQVVEQCR
ncbi:hypothetical protein [Planctomicrobium sp. SH664]|uniref:hypothetical protein n=1 Tax=Planctomicrobium sp. SH664 TaxID=3448125 RepID=UPI003F5C972C